MGVESLNPVIAGAEALSGLIKTGVGLFQTGKANKLLKGLQYPNEQIPQEITDAAATGLPSEQYNLAMKNIQRQQLQALRGTQDRRGGLGLISGIQTGTNDATAKLDSENAAARQNNLFRLASWKDKIWQNNIKDKYTRDYDYAMKLKGMGNQNTFGGFDQILGSGTTFAGSGGFNSGGRTGNTTNNSVHNLAGGY